MANTPRKYYCLFKFDREEAAMFDERVTDALNFIQKEGEKKSRAAVTANDYAIILERGIDAIEEDMIANKEETHVVVIAKQLAKIRKKKAKMRGLAKIYDDMGLDEFVSWCEGESIQEWKQMESEEYNKLFGSQTQTWNERAGEWLAELLGDGKSHHVNEVKKEAIQAGIINDADNDTIDRDWNKLKVLAHRERYSSRKTKGWWEEG